MGMPGMSRRWVNRILALVVLAGATTYLAATYNLPRLEFGGSPGGIKLFPMLIGITALLSGLMLLLESVFRPPAADTAPGAPGQPLAVLGVLAWMLGFYLLLEPLGFLVACAMFLLGLTSFFHRGHWWTNTAVSLLFSIGTYLLFTRLLGVGLPGGILRIPI